MSTGSLEFGKPPSGLTKLNDHSADQDDGLQASRAALQFEMDKMRRSLTLVEQAFLESLVVNGNEIEVQVARKRLSDFSIFLPHEDEKVENDHRDDEGFGDSMVIGRGTFVEIEGDFDTCTPNTAAPPRPSIARRSSVKVVQALQSRRTSEVHGKIWKAHESGIAVTENGARKMASRRASEVIIRPGNKERMLRESSFMSSATRALLLEGGTTEQGSSGIFRESSSSTIERQQQALFNTIDAISPILPKSIMRPSELPSPLSIAPLKSNAFRKAVSFHKDEPRQRSQSFSKGASTQVSRNPLRREVSDLSLGSECGESHIFSSTSTMEASASLQQGKAATSGSLASFPSLHEANTIQSESLSIPSLHRAAPVRSESIASTVLSNSSDPAEQSPNSTEVHRKPILLRMASRNIDLGEGIEVTELDDDVETVDKARLYASMMSTGDISTASSWDETAERKSIFRQFRRTMSDDENLTSYFLGSAKSLLSDSVRTDFDDKPDLEVDDDSWDLGCETEEHPDAWDVLKDPNAIGYGANGTLPFRIFGTSADDESAKPHVLSPPLMESLQNFLPYGLSEQNFWMKYSLVRDGASMHSLLQHIRGAKHTIIALETSDGEVFGTFTSEVWRKNWNYFGTGESFLWRMRQPRTTECHSVEEQAHLESELDVYPWTGENNCVQLCTHDTIAVGGGSPTSEKKDETEAEEKIAYGFGIAIDRLLLHGTSSHCATFGSPPLSKLHPDGSPFEIMNLEVWTLTPSYSLGDAEKLELGKLFLSGQ